MRLGPYHPREGGPQVFWGVVTAGVLGLLGLAWAFAWPHVRDAVTHGPPSQPPASAVAPQPGPSGSWQAGWGPERPTFTVDDPAPYAAFNSITDNPDIGDERNFVGLRKAGSDPGMLWQDDVWAQPGDRYVMRVYVNNSGTAPGTDVPQTSIHGARITIGLFEGDREFSVAGVLSAENVKTVWDGATIHVDDGVVVEFAVDTARVETNAGTRRLGGTAFTPEGALLGYRKADGFVRPFYSDSEYVSVQLTVRASTDS